MIDLQKFCADEDREPFRDYLHTPFVFGEYSYATNGHIMVRVPKISGMRVQTKEGEWDVPLNGFETAQYGALLHKPCPPPPDPCVACEGRGTEHDCPDCECTCTTCHGVGTPRISTTIRGGIFDLRYVEMMLALPEVLIQMDRTGEAPLLFNFNGGIGAIMPMRGEHAEHIEIEADKAA